MTVSTTTIDNGEPCADRNARAVHTTTVTPATSISATVNDRTSDAVESSHGPDRWPTAGRTAPPNGWGTGITANSHQRNALVCVSEGTNGEAVRAGFSARTTPGTARRPTDEVTPESNVTVTAAIRTHDALKSNHDRRQGTPPEIIATLHSAIPKTGNCSDHSEVCGGIYHAITTNVNDGCHSGRREVSGTATDAIRTKAGCNVRISSMDQRLAAISLYAHGLTTLGTVGNAQALYSSIQTSDEMVMESKCVGDGEGDEQSEEIIDLAEDECDLERRTKRQRTDGIEHIGADDVARRVPQVD